MLKKNKVKEVLALIDEFDGNELAKLHYKDKKFGVLISEKNPKGSRPVHSVSVERVSSIDTPIKIENPAGLQESGVSPAPVAVSSAHQVIAPMTGAFYGRPKPEEDAFVKVGSIVEADTTVCLLEAMKMFNEVKAGVKGKIVKVLYNDGDFVSENDPMFEIQPM